MNKIYCNRFNIFSYILKFIMKLYKLARKKHNDSDNNDKITSKIIFLLSKKKDYERIIKIYNNIDDYKSLYIKFLITSRMHNHRIYNTSIENSYRNIYYKTRELTVLMRFFEFLTQKYGYKSKKVKELITSIIDNKSILYLSKKKRIKLYTAILVNNIFNNDIEKLNFYNYFNIETKKIHNIYLCHDSYANKNNNSIYNGSLIYEKLKIMQENFEKLLSDNKNKICVVGNAPTEINTFHGNIIDNFPIVVRFNNYSLEYPKDYGKKVTIHVRVANNEIQIKNINKHYFTVFTKNNFLYLGPEQYFYSLPFFMSERNFTFIPNSIFAELIQKLSRLPSSGLLFLYYLYKINGIIDSKSIFGFSYNTDVSFNSHYCDENLYSYRHLHDADREAKIFLKIIGG